MELFEIITWVKFNKPGLKEEVIKLGESCEDEDEFRNKLMNKYNIDLSTAFSISRRFYKPKNK